MLLKHLTYSLEEQESKDAATQHRNGSCKAKVTEDGNFEDSGIIPFFGCNAKNTGGDEANTPPAKRQTRQSTEEGSRCDDC